MHAVIGIDKSMHTFFDLFVTNVGLLSQVLELWIFNSVNGVLFSWIWSWVHAVIGIDKSMDLFIDFLISDVVLIMLS